jgi:putative transposase
MTHSLPHRKTRRRYSFPNSIHELAFSCYRNLPLLVSERTCKNLAVAVVQASNNLDYSVIAYVFMPTHAHLLVMPNEAGCSISDFLKSVKQSAARKELIYLKRNEPENLKRLETGWQHAKYLFWQRGGGYDRNITEPETLRNSIDYINNNPLRKGLVENACDWKWSSARDWLRDEQGVIPVHKIIF